VRALDAVVFAAALAAIGLISWKVYAGGASAPRVYLHGASAEWIYPLDSPRTVAIPGPLGDTVVQIAGGEVRVLSSPCKEKICIRSGAIARPGQWIACLPNRAFIEIRGRSQEPVDAYSW
jgi:hypothetical protein